MVVGMVGIKREGLLVCNAGVSDTTEILVTKFSNDSSSFSLT